MENIFYSFYKKYYLILPLVLFTILLIRVLYFYQSSYLELIQIIPDDAFYYLVLAKNKLVLDFWTFDEKTAATGFHLFYGYFLLFIMKFFYILELNQIFLFIGIISSLLISGALFLQIIICKNIFGHKSAIISSITFFSPIVIGLSTSLMEVSFLIFFLYFY